MQDFFGEALSRLLDDLGTPADVRRIEAGGDRGALWGALVEGGFVDALRPEEQGGSGLDLSDVFGLLTTAGRYGLPVPLAISMLVRGMGGDAVPAGVAIAVADRCRREENGALYCEAVPFGALAEWVVVDESDGARLLPCTQAEVRTCGHRALEADIVWRAEPAQSAVLERSGQWRSLAASATAALLAGAMEQVLEMTLRFASERAQFGKPIGRFQAIQQQLSVMAEQVAASAMAAQIGLRGGGRGPSAMVAKARASAAVPAVAAIAHAVHGAMGFTEECDLQLYTRRLHEWRRAYGAESHWHRELGVVLLASQPEPALDTLHRWMTTAAC